MVDNCPDPDFQLKVAAMANKAVRRHRNSAEPLNPVAAGVRVNLSLTQRFVEKLQNGTRVEERRIDVSDAGKYRLSAKDVSGFLGTDSSPSSRDELSGFDSLASVVS